MVEHSEKPVELAALRLLARREHCVEELKRKLLSGGHARAAVDVVIERLAARQLISDARYASSRVRQWLDRGQGPVRIRAELRRQGIADELIQAGLDGASCDWKQRATSVRVRRFGNRLPHGSAERAKQARFLQYRGFTADQIRAALGPDADLDGTGMDAAFRSDPDLGY